MSTSSRLVDLEHYAVVDLDEKGAIVGAYLYCYRDVTGPPLARWVAVGHYLQALPGSRYWCAERDRREDDQTRRLLDEQEVEIVEKRGVWHVAFEGLDKCASGRRGCGYATRLAALDHAVCVAQEYEEWRI